MNIQQNYELDTAFLDGFGKVWTRLSKFDKKAGHTQFTDAMRDRVKDELAHNAVDPFQPTAEEFKTAARSAYERMTAFFGRAL